MRQRHAPIPKPRRGERDALREHKKREQERSKIAAKRAWKATVSGVCAMCAAAKAGPLVQPITWGVREDFHNDLVRFEGHHLIPEADLRRMGYPVEVQFDLRLQLTLCRYHHARHENFVERIPAELYPPSVYAFAAEHNIMWLLERERDA